MNRSPAPLAAATGALTAAAVGVGWVAKAAWNLPAELGASRDRIAPRAAASPNYRDGRFHNILPSSTITSPSPGLIAEAVSKARAGRPPGVIPLVTPLAPAHAADCAVTWFGHSSAIVEIDGHRILTDPVWSERVSPSQMVGPARLHPVPAPLRTLPTVDAVVISHDHYDHLDRATIRDLAAHQATPFVVPLGVGEHLRLWGVPDERIIELDWNESTVIGDLTITCTEARHFSGRTLIRDSTQWASWAFAGPTRRVFFGGDTGYTPAFADIGASYGPFDLTLLPVGAYNERWRDIHMDPEEAVRSHIDLQGGDAEHGLVVPVHWATFNLAFHPWAEPAERLTTEARRRGVGTAVPKPGQRVDATVPVGDIAPWWRLA